MSDEKSRLVIHTRLIPQSPIATEEKRPRFKMPKLPSVRMPRLGARKIGAARFNRRSQPGQKLLRNTSIACALVMCVMALASIDAPWSKNAVEAVSNAVTMTVNLDDTLGRLNFVKEWMPEAALVFWNMGTENSIARPVSAPLTHEFSTGQPWQEYQTSGEQPVYAAQDGRVAAVMENPNGEWTLMIDHDKGEQTVYAYLGKAIVKSGQSVIKGAQIAITSPADDSRLYFEMRKGGESVDPAERMTGS